MKNRRISIARKSKLAETGRDFDLKFWRMAGAEARFAAMWQMVKDAAVIKGKNGNQQRLQRSVEHIKRLRG